MTQKAIIFHGMGANTDEYWYPYVKNTLEEKGYEVFIPALPHPGRADLKDWLPFALSMTKYDSDTILIGHSAGCALILSILENIDQPIKQAILVSGFIEQLTPDGNFPILQEKYDWDKIGANCQQFIIINSDNDPWGCDDKMGRKIFDNLGGTLIIPHGEGHMGSSSFNQPYKEFPLLTKLIV